MELVFYEPGKFTVANNIEEDCFISLLKIEIPGIGLIDNINVGILPYDKKNPEIDFDNILGRDFLNKLGLYLNGPAQEFTITTF